MNAHIKNEYIRYAGNFVLSAIAPETIVAAVAAKTAWNIQKANCHSPSGVVGLAVLKKKPSVPMSPDPLVPNMIPKPTNQNAIEPRLKSIRFFIKMLQAFLALVKPVSTIANPACIKNTRKAAINVQIVSIATALVSIDIADSFLS